MIVLMHSAKLAGAEICATRYAARLAHLGPRYIILEDGPIVDRLRTEGATIEVVDNGSASFRALKRGATLASILSTPRTILGGLRAVRRAMRITGRGELVVAVSIKSAMIAWLAGIGHGVKVVCWVHDRVSAEYFGRTKSAVLRRLITAISHAIVVNSQSTLDTLGHVRVPHLIAYPPVDSELLSLERRPLSSELRIVMVGRISEWKGQDVLIRAMATVPQDLPAQVTIVGSPLFGEVEYMAKLTHLVKLLGLQDRVRFREHTEDVISVLRDNDVLVHASVLPEPFGMVIVEGMAAGCAVVASEAGGPREIIQHGFDGLLVSPGDAAAYGRAITMLARDRGVVHYLATNARVTARRYTSNVLGPPLADWLEKLS